MSCTATPTKGELQFVLALHTRTKAGGECRGPLVALTLEEAQAFTFARIFDSRSASDLLWDGFIAEADRPGLTFELCGAHWLDLACLIWMRAQQLGRRDYHEEADQLLRDVCEAAGWDPKEIVNMFQWQSARLT